MATVDERAAEGFFLADPAKVDDPFPDMRYLREHHPVFHYQPLGQWFVFTRDDVDALLHDERLSADRMKGFVEPPRRSAAPICAGWCRSSSRGCS